MKKILYIGILICTLLPATVFAQTAVPTGQSEFGAASTPPAYVLLAPLPCLGTSNGTTCTSGTNGSEVTSISIEGYLIYLFKLLIAFAVFLAVIVTIYGGFEYMTTEAVTGKQVAKARIENAVYGLLLALASYLILYTINPNLVNLSEVAVPKLNVAASSTVQNAVDGLSSASQAIAANSEGQITNAINTNAQATTNLQTDQNTENQIQDEIDACDSGVTSCDPISYAQLQNQLAQAEQNVTTDTQQVTTQTSVGEMENLVNKDVPVSNSALNSSQTGTTLTQVSSDLSTLQNNYITADQALGNDANDKQTLTSQYQYSNALLTDEQALLSVKSGTMTASAANTAIQAQNNIMANNKNTSLQQQYQAYSTQVQSNVAQIESAQSVGIQQSSPAQ